MESFKVALDVTPLGTHLKGYRGIGQSILRLVREMKSSHLPFELIYYSTEKVPRSGIIPEIKINLVPDTNNLPEVLMRDGVSLIHFSDYFYPLYNPTHFREGKFDFLHTVITVYDMIPYLFPEKRAKLIHRLNDNLLPVLEHVSMIRVCSQATKNDLVRLTGTDPNKINVIYHGLDHTTFHPEYPENEVAAIRKFYGLENGFILQVGTFNWRKNQIALLKAYKKMLENKYTIMDLVYVGGLPGKEITDFINQNNLGSRVRFLGYVPENHMPLLYNAAEVFVFPSFYEGFGFPPLEAMACGLPVVSSNRGSLQEILKDSAIYTDPDNTADLAEAIFTVCSQLYLKEVMIKRGLELSKKYTKKSTVAALLKIYLDLLNSREE